MNTISQIAQHEREDRINARYMAVFAVLIFLAAATILPAFVMSAYGFDVEELADASITASITGVVVVLIGRVHHNRIRKARR